MRPLWIALMMNSLPPKWYAKAERWLILNKWLIIFGIFAGSIVALSFVAATDPLDDQLIKGIDK